MRNKKNKGFLLVELMIAMFIIVVCFLTILGVFPVTYKSVIQARDILFATGVARRQMERVCARDYQDYGLSLSNGIASYTCEVEGRTSTAEFIYNVTVTPDDYAGVSASSIKNVVIMIYNSADPNKYVKIETDIAREE